MDGAVGVEARPAALTNAQILAAQNFPLAVLAGLATSLLAAIGWAAVTLILGWKLSFLAVGVGYLVSLAVRITGHGIDKKFAILGAVCGFVGCAFGDVLSDIVFYAGHNGGSIPAALGQLDPGSLTGLVRRMFQPMDAFFYGIAVYAGYRYSCQYRRKK